MHNIYLNFNPLSYEKFSDFLIKLMESKMSRTVH